MAQKRLPHLLWMLLSAGHAVNHCCCCPGATRADLNVLEHQKLFAALQPILQLLASRGPVDIADLGCGDCAFTAHTLLGAGVQLASFTAVDVAGPALQLARHNLAFLPPNCCVSLVEQSLQDFVLQEECAGRFDVVISAFAVHHLRWVGLCGL